MRIQSVVLSAVLALLVISAQARAQTAAPQPGTPTAAPNGTPTAPPPPLPPLAPSPLPGGQSQSYNTAPQYSTQAGPYAQFPQQPYSGPRYPVNQGPIPFSQAFNPNYLTTSWVSDCVPQGTIVPSQLIPGGGLYYQRAIYNFSPEQQGQFRMTYSVWEFRDPFCTQPTTEVVEKVGAWRLRAIPSLDGSVGELIFSYDFCRDQSRPVLNDPDHRLCDSDFPVHSVKIQNNVLVFGHPVSGPEGQGYLFNYSHRYYIYGTSPTDYMSQQGQGGQY